MKESIYTIPISEVFEPMQGCPICTLHNALDARWIEYITGAAMMEPDVRLETNAQGFCGGHLKRMLGQRNRLSVALLLQTRLEHLIGSTKESSSKRGRIFPAKKVPKAPACFVCAKVNAELKRCSDNIAAIWKQEESFRVLFASQERLCTRHHALLYESSKKMRKKDAKAFLSACDLLLQKGLGSAKRNIDTFCRMYDYHYAAQNTIDENTKNAIEAAARQICHGWEDREI